MRLRVDHETRYCYDAPVAYGLQQTRLRPKDARGQKVLDWTVTIEGGASELRYEDHNRNIVDLIGIEPGRTETSIRCVGLVENTASDGVVGEHKGFLPLWHFKRSSPLTEPGEGIRKLASAFENADKTSVGTGHDLSAAILDAEEDGPSTWISGGARRDWFFSLAVADSLDRPHLYLFKDGRVADVDSEGNLRFVDDLTDATSVHIADLVTEASSYDRAWIPALRERGGEMVFSANVVDRAQGGMDVLKKAGVPATALLRVDGDLFSALSRKGLIDNEQLQTLMAYFKDPKSAMGEFLSQHPDFIQQSLSSDDERTVARARQLVEQDPYDLGLRL